MVSFTRQTAGEISSENDLNQLQVSLEQRGINVRDPLFGAIGDGVADDTTALQAAITAAVNAGVPNVQVYLPAGTYKITAALTIPFAPGFRLVGAGRLISTIRQYGTNVPILKFSGDLTHDVDVLDLGLWYNALAGGSDTDSYGIQFTAVADATMFGIILQRLYIRNAYCGIGVKTGAGISLPVWGLLIADSSIIHTVWRGISWTPTDASGTPNVTLRNIYITNTGGGPTPTSHAINMIAAGGLTAENLDIEGWAGRLISISGHSLAAQISNVHIENCAWTSGSNDVIIDIANGGASLKAISISGTVNMPGLTLYAIRADVSADITIDDLILNCTITSGTVWGFSGGGGSPVPTIHARNCFDVSTGGTHGPHTTATSWPQVRSLDGEPFVPPITKTAAYTALNPDRTILCDATAGAFTVTLPAVGSCPLGKRFVFSKIDSSANAVTIDGSGAELINGAATQALATQWKHMEIENNGTAWYITGNN